MLKKATLISRILIGILFVYSGFVKLVDPIGSKIKFEEYFNENVLNLEFLIPYALPFAIILIIAELALGFMLLVGYKPKITVWSIFGLTLIFLFLTWYSYTFNKVTDCGCFGDAIKLTAKETFYKNVFFIGIILILIKGIKNIKPLISLKFATLSTYIIIFFSFFIIYYVLTHLPIIDFRPYSVGTNIAEGMKYKGDGEIPLIHDFSIETEEDGDQLNAMLSKEKAFLIVVYNFNDINKEKLTIVSQTAKKAKEKGYEVYILTASYLGDLAQIKEEWLPYTFGTCDETALKTVIRANPGIITVEKGIIVGKWNWTDADDVILK